MNDATSKCSVDRAPPFARPLLAATLAAAAFAPATVTAAQFDYFLRLDGIPGDAAAAKEKWIEIQGWDWEVTAESSWTKASGAARPLCDGLRLIKRVDSATVKLFEALATGRRIGTGQLAVIPAASKELQWYDIHLGDITVTAVRNIGTSADSDALQETVTLRPANYKFVYQPLRPDGSPGAAEITFSGDCPRS